VCSYPPLLYERALMECSLCQERHAVVITHRHLPSSAYAIAGEYRGTLGGTYGLKSSIHRVF